MISPLSMIKKDSLKEEALTHRSFTQELKLQMPDNERLEFLGDALLDLWMAEMLMKQFPTDNEGTLSKKRASLVNEEVLSHKARLLGFDKQIKLGPAEARTGGSSKASLLSDTFEAVLAALYLDQGFDLAKSWLETIFKEDIKALENKEFEKDYKSRFQEWAQSELKKTPLYFMTEELGPAHLREFRVEVKIENQTWGSGSGTSKKKAEQKAAEVALLSPLAKTAQKSAAKTEAQAKVQVHIKAATNNKTLSSKEGATL